MAKIAGEGQRLSPQKWVGRQAVKPASCVWMGHEATRKSVRWW
ncbi:MAG: hypothetical protein ACLRP3_07300 [Escherichia sp.]